MVKDLGPYDKRGVKAAADRFVPGQPRGAGAPKPILHGVARLREVLREQEFDVIVEAVKRYRGKDTPSASKDFCLGLIADRVLPKLKSIEVIGTMQESRQVLIEIVSGVESMRLEAENVLPDAETTHTAQLLESAILRDDEEDEDEEG